MPSYIVRKVASSRDGSSLGGGQIVISAPDILQAKQQGAEQLGVSVAHVAAEPFANPHWEALRSA